MVGASKPLSWDGCFERAPFSKPLTLLAGGLTACTVQMGMGIVILAQFVGWNLVWSMGLFPFIPGEILKVLLVSFGFASKLSSK